VTGRGAGLIEAPATMNNAYSWLSGGGIGLQGTQIMAAPASDITGPWSMVMAGSMIGSVGAPGTERLAGVVEHRGYGVSPQRGAALYLRGGTDWNAGSPTPFYSGRSYNNGSPEAPSVLAPSSGFTTIGMRRLHVLSYDGLGTLAATVYNAAASAISTTSWAATAAQFGLNGGVTLTSLQPSIGMSSTTFPHGDLQAEAFAVYGRELAQEDVQVILDAVTALGVSRGRVWV